MAKLRFCGADEARARASAGISRNPRYPPPPKAAAPSGGECRSFETAAKQERRPDRMVKSPFSAVRTRLELATPGVTGRYSKPTELPHQLSVNFPFGIAKVQLKFDSANILKEFNEKNVRLCAGHSLERDREVYLTSICLRTFSGSTFLTLAMVTVRTPCSTLAAMSSRFASSGRSIVCWNLV